VAALAEGGGRLSVDDLPLVLKYADDADPQMQLAALAALSHFGDPPAIERLLFYARKNVEPTASAAIESLAASRYAAAHEALLGILKNEQPASRRLIVRLLARYPRPIWSDTIYSFVSDGDPEVAVEALKALVQVGHPRLFEVLKDALTRGSQPMREQAFQLLAARTDRDSEELALEYTLSRLKETPPTPAMYGLLSRTKDPRAIPLLLAQLDKSAANRTQLIGMLAQIGDQTVSAELARRYPKLGDRDKTAALNALQQLKSPEFRKLAGEALAGNDTSLVNAAVVGLQADGSQQAVSLLVGALETSTNPAVWSQITNALGNFGTPESKAALNKARDSQNATKRNLALAALRALRQRSAGYPYCLQARQAAQNERWDDAIARYVSAIELDPELPEAYSGRGHALLQQKKVPEARKDFAKAVELDPFSSEAVTGLGICLVMSGELPEGIKVIEGSRARMNDDALFAYNAACVYGRALAHVLKQPKSAEHDKLAETYRGQAIADLRRSVKLGFPDFDWMKKDPDLESLHGASDFKKLVNQETGREGAPDGKTPKPEKADEGDGGNADDGGDSTPADAARVDLLFENARP
jgi:HEAT repeat protein